MILNDASSNGLEAEIMKRAHAGTVVFGICGGYQNVVRTFGSGGVEEGGDTAGLGLLDVETIFAEKKRTIQVDGYFGKVKGIFSALTGLSFYGYEIHSGITNFDDGKSLTLMKPIHEAGEISPEGFRMLMDTMNVMVYICTEYLMVKVLLNLWWKLYLLKRV